MKTLKQREGELSEMIQVVWSSLFSSTGNSFDYMVFNHSTTYTPIQRIKRLESTIRGRALRDISRQSVIGRRDASNEIALRCRKWCKRQGIAVSFESSINNIMRIRKFNDLPHGRAIIALVAQLLSARGVSTLGSDARQGLSAMIVGVVEATIASGDMFVNSYSTGFYDERGCSVAFSAGVAMASSIRRRVTDPYIPTQLSRKKK